MALRFILPLLALLLSAAPALAEPAFLALCYHDVLDDASGELAIDRMATGTVTLVSHFQWLKENGYTVISLDDVEAAREGRRPLPEKAVLLTFDDGLKSVYTRVFPLLKLFRYPAVVSVVGSWMEATEGWTLNYGPGKTLRRSDFATWGELKEMQDSGLVEIATHTFDLHSGIPANPQGNELPAATALEYDPETKGYESERTREIRLRADLSRAAALHRERLGALPRAIAWPYGEHNALADRLAREMGITLSFGLESRPQPLAEVGGGIRRYLIMDNPGLQSFVKELDAWREPEVVRAVHIDLDYVFDPDPAQQERNLDLLLERIKRLRITTVYLQAFADPDGDGTASALYFPNRHLPVRGDLFNRVAWQLRTRAGVGVYAWMPVLAFDLPDKALSERLSVEKWEKGERRPSREGYRRLSPYKPQARKIVGEIYEDLARHAAFQGVLFHDDAFLNEKEDAAGGKNGSLPSAREKTETLIDFTEELAIKVRTWRPAVKTARNLYARVVTEPESETRFAQNLELFLTRYDHTALMAMPHMEKAPQPEKWLADLAEAVARRPRGLEKTVFELQTKDWQTGQPVPAQKLTSWMRLLMARGAVNLGYYPDDFHKNHPDLDRVHAVFSVENFPYPRR